MRVVYVLPHAHECGGVRVIAEHVSRLAARGHQAEVWGLTGDFRWFGRPVKHLRFGSTERLGDSLRSTLAVKVATFWITASWVASSLRAGERGYYLIQDEDELRYGGSNAGTSYRLGLVPVTEGRWVTEEIERKYGTPCTNVGIGVDHEVFRPLSIARERYRVLLAYRKGQDRLKGWDTATEVIRLAKRREKRLSVVTFGGGSCEVPGVPHIHVGRVSDEKLRELYAQSGVYLACSRFEGFGLPMLEAMAVGCPVVCTDAGGNREFCRHDDTARIGESARELADHVVAVMGNPSLSDRMNSSGRQEAKRYNWDTVIDRLETLYRG